MHTIGLIHEHARPDRDNYIAINWDNIARADWKNFMKRNHYTQFSDREFDFNSVMLYGPKAFSVNGNDTLTSKVENVTLLDIDEKPLMSEGDIRLVNQLYRCDRQN